MRVAGFLGVLALGACVCSARVAAEPALGVDRVYSEPAGWTVGVSPDRGCLSYATYEDHTTVWFGFNGSGQSVLALTNEGWDKFRPGRRYRIEIRAQGRGRWRGMFTGIEHNGEPGLYALDLETEFLVDLAAAGGIHIHSEGRPIARLSLSGSSAALRDTIACMEALERGASEGRQSRRPDEQARAERRDEGSSTSRRDERPEPEVRRDRSARIDESRQKGRQQERQQEERGAESDGGSSTGTGFFVTDRGDVLTNHHVIEDCSVYRVEPPGGRPVRARLVASDADKDLALLRTDAKPGAVAAFNLGARLGASVYVFGFPLGGLLATSGNFTDGAITATAGLGNDENLLQISAPVQPGNSGGPVKDQSAHVVGVVVSKLNALRVAEMTDDVPQNVNFAIKAHVAAAFLQKHGVTPRNADASARMEPADIADEAKKFTVRVACD